MHEQASELYDAFLCHNMRDKDAVRAIHHRLTHWGYSVWLDENVLRAGQTLDEQVSDGVENSTSAIVCLGPNFVGDYTENVEFGFLKKRFKNVICVLLPGVDASAQAVIERHFDNTLYVDFSRRSINALDPGTRQAAPRSGRAAAAKGFGSRFRHIVLALAR